MKLLVDVSAGLAIADVLRHLGIFTHYRDQLPGLFSVYQDGRLRIR